MTNTTALAYANRRYAADLVEPQPEGTQTMPPRIVNGYEIGPGADLYLADLTGADLSGADLRGADLVGAILCRANLTNANLRDANLRSADLTDAKGILRVGPAQDGIEFFGVIRGDTVWIKADFHWFTAAAARKRWARTPPGDERLRFVDFIEATLLAQMEEFQ